MSSQDGLTGEQWDHKLAAVFDDEADAQAATDAVLTSTGLPDSAVRLLAPGDSDSDRLLEPESHGIWRTMVRAHVWLGLIGAVVGALLFAVLMAVDIAFIAGNRAWAFFMLVILCGVGGLLLGGLVTLRPDHVPFIAVARTALDDGKYVVVVHSPDEQTLTQARRTLDRLKVRSLQTF